MDQTELEPSAGEQPEKERTRLSKELIGIVAALALAVVSIGYTWFLTQQLNTLKKELYTATYEMGKWDDRIAWLENRVGGLLLSQEVSDNVVTDDFYVDRAMLFTENGKISGRVDIETQPTLVLSYKGQGRFDLSDRELSASLLKLMRSLEEATSLYGSIEEITITIRNYDVATYSEGKISLAGD